MVARLCVSPAGALDAVWLCWHRQGNLVQREYEPLDRSERQYLGVDTLPGGIIGPAPGSGGFSGAAWARRLRILIATISVLANFRFTPFEP